MVYLMCQRKSHQVVKVMGHDVKQFKSLEGFLESGPQFVLQSYIILRGDKKGFEDFESVDAGKTYFAHSLESIQNPNPLREIRKP